MLILSRKPGECIVIDGKIVVRVMRVEGEVVKLGIDAPVEIPVHRQEVYEEIRRNNKEAMIDKSAALPHLARKKPTAKPERGLPRDNPERPPRP
jgi:carbon storage regulator